MDSVKGSVNGQIIQCTFSATLPRNTGTSFVLSVSNGTVINGEALIQTRSREKLPLDTDLGSASSSPIPTLTVSGGNAQLTPDQRIRATSPYTSKHPVDTASLLSGLSLTLSLSLSVLSFSPPSVTGTLGSPNTVLFSDKAVDLTSYNTNVLNSLNAAPSSSHAFGLSQGNKP